MFSKSIMTPVLRQKNNERITFYHRLLRRCKTRNLCDYKTIIGIEKCHYKKAMANCFVYPPLSFCMFVAIQPVTVHFVLSPKTSIIPPPHLMNHSTY